MKKILNKKFIKAFTLVELIIVITILAILATIAFISFQGYTKTARDSNRTSTLTNLQKGLDVYGVQVGLFPEPEGTILSGTLNGTQLNRLGIISDTISRLVKSNKTPTDPVSGNNYVYGISSDNKYYQIGTTLENLETYNGITNITFADNGSFKSKVVGNYKYPLKLGNKLYSLPSLLFTGTGGDLTITGSAYFIVDKGLNIPYTPDKTPLNNTQVTTLVLQSITGTGNLVLTGITLPSITSTEFKALTNTSTILQSLQQGLGVTDQTQLGNVIYGSNYSSSTSVSSGGSSNSCNSTQPSNAILTTGSPTSSNQAWQNTNSSNPCYYTCASGYAYNGSSCVTATTCTLGLTEITIGTGATIQTWSCMNLGATQVRDGSTQPTNCGGSSTNCNTLNWLGDYYQWGRSNTGRTNGQAGWNNDWQTPQIDNAWGGSTSDTATSDGAGTTKTGRQGPCPTGWHVPSAKDWQDMCNTVLNTTCTNSMSYNSLISSKLRLPFAGQRSWLNGYYYYQSTTAYYQSSSPYTTMAYNLTFNSSTIWIPNYYDRSYGLSIRCIKN